MNVNNKYQGLEFPENKANREIETDKVNLCKCVNCIYNTSCSLGICMNRIVFELSKNFIDITDARPEKNKASTSFKKTECRGADTNTELSVELSMEEINEIFETMMNSSITDKYNKNVEWIKANGMNMQDFFCNCAMAVLDILCSNIKSTRTTTDVIRQLELEGKEITREQLKYKQMGINRTKSLKVEDDKKYTWNGIYLNEIKAVLYDITKPDIDMDEDEKIQVHGTRKNLLLNLILFKNMSPKNFTKDRLEELIKYFEELYYYFDELEDISEDERILIFYHLELETRFKTFLRLLERFKKLKLYKEDGYKEKRLEASRGFSKIRKNFMIQNRIFCGIDNYIDEIAETDINQLNSVLKKMCEISEYIHDVSECSCKDIEYSGCFDCEFIRELLNKVQENSKIIIDAKDIRIKDFIDIYTPDDKRE